MRIILEIPDELAQRSGSISQSTSAATSALSGEGLSGGAAAVTESDLLSDSDAFSGGAAEQAGATVTPNAAVLNPYDGGPAPRF